MRDLKKSKVVTALFFGILTVSGPLISPPTASAAYVTGCHKIACVEVFTGSKNYANRTQYVNQVTVFSTAGSGFLEIWGDGFYKSKNGSSGTWAIHKWARSGTYVCGAVTVQNVPRRVACIAIRV